MLSDIRADLGSRQWRIIWLLALLVLGGAYGLIFLLLPFDEPQPRLGEALGLLGAVTLMLGVANALAVAALRIAGNSDRAPFAIDASWWLSFVVSLIVWCCFPVVEAIVLPLGLQQWLHLALANMLAAILVLIIARWRAAVAVEGPRAPIVANIAAVPRYFVPAAILAVLVLGPLGTLNSLFSQMATVIVLADDLKLTIVNTIAATLFTLFELALIASIYRQTNIEPAGAAS